MNEQRLLKRIFGDKDAGPWKGRYEIDFCHLCDTFMIICPDCGNTSCNGGGCDKCLNDSIEFANMKTSVIGYLSEDEIKIYEKTIRLRSMIEQSLYAGYPEINWLYLQNEGYMSKNDEQLFAKELDGLPLKQWDKLET